MSHGNVKRRKVEKVMRECNFWVDREGKKHTIWTNGRTEITMSRSRYIHPNHARQAIKQAREAYGKLSVEVAADMLARAMGLIE